MIAYLVLLLAGSEPDWKKESSPPGVTLESRPVKGRPWEYVFYLDYLRGEDDASRNALRHLSEVAEFVKVTVVSPDNLGELELADQTRSDHKSGDATLRAIFRCVFR